jgi:pimeloyl-ACP methyl ester carboxylesterase
MAIVHRDSVRLVFDEYGQTGPTVLLLHGLAGYAGEWAMTGRCLSSAYRIIALDQRGHGRSRPLRGDMSRAAYVADVISVIEAVGVGPVVLIGHSLGGHTAMLTAAERPDSVAALIVVEATPAHDAEAPDRVRQWLSSWPIPFTSREAAADYFTGLNDFRSSLAAQVWAAGLEERADGWYPPFTIDAMVDSLREVAVTEYWDQWVSIRCPVLIVRGEWGAVSKEHADRMVGLLPAARETRIVGAGHDVHLDQPDRWHNTAAAFLESVVR